MFDFDAGKMLIVGVLALIFIPPKDLPRVMRQAGQLVGKMRRMAAEFQGQFMDAMREADMADIRHEAQKLAEAARVDTGAFDELRDLDRQMTAEPVKAHVSHPAEAEEFDTVKPTTEAAPLSARPSDQSAGPETVSPAPAPHTA